MQIGINWLTCYVLRCVLPYKYFRIHGICMSHTYIIPIRVWHELLFKEKGAGYCMQIDLEEQVLSIPVSRVLSEDDVALLGMLICQHQNFSGVKSLRRMETRGIRASSFVASGVGGVRVMGCVCCVNDRCVMLFEEKEHMQLYLSIATLGGLPFSIYGPLCSALQVGSDLRHSQVRLATFDGSVSLLAYLHSSEMWLDLVKTLWKDAECVTLEEWNAGRHRSAFSSMENYMMSAIGDEASFYALHCLSSRRVSRSFTILERTPLGRHVRCMFITVRHTKHGDGLCFGSVLFASYVGFEERMKILQPRHG